MAFKSNRELLNVNFEGYKLSEEGLQQITSNLPDGIKRKVLGTDCFSYQHVRRATMSNLLVPDQWNRSMVYWITATNKIMSACHQSPDGICIKPVFTVDKHHTQMEPESTTESNPSICFVSVSKALFYDPNLNPNYILLLETGNRASGLMSNWEIICQITPPTLDFVIESAKINHNILDIIISSIQPESINSSCSIQYIRANSLVDSCSTVIWTLNSSTIPLYCAMFNESIVIITESNLVNHCTTDQPLSTDIMDVSSTHMGLGYSTDYNWDQSEEDITITIPLSDNISKGDISCVIDSDSIVVGLTDGTTFVRGNLFDVIDPETSTWTIENKKLEITLEKKDHGSQWSSLLNNVIRSDEQLPLERNDLGLTEDEMIQLTERINATTTDGGKRVFDGPVDSPSKRSKPIFQDTREDCDILGDKEINCILVNGDGVVINKTSLGCKELLFTLPQSRHDSNACHLCLKHDIDALVYSSESSIHWNHTHTFNALGYVQASKRDRKFLTCDSKCTYAVLTDCNRHVFVYLQPANGVKGHTAIQYVHTLDSAEEILGVYANEGVVFVLCENVLFQLKLP